MERREPGKVQAPFLAISQGVDSPRFSEGWGQRSLPSVFHADFADFPVLALFSCFTFNWLPTPCRKYQRLVRRPPVDFGPGWQVGADTSQQGEVYDEGTLRRRMDG
jgi:hypothetical protein